MRARNKIAAVLSTVAVVGGGATVLAAAPAMAVAPSGGCSTWFVAPGTPINDTTPAASYLGAIKGPWSDENDTGVEADYDITTSGGSTVGSTRNFSLTYDKGMKSFAPATGDMHWFFSVNGVVQPAIVQSGVSLPGGVTAAGGTIDGSFTITESGTNTVALHKLVFDATAGVRVVCSGQETATATVNPHTTPIDTNVSGTFSAVGPTATISAVSNQAVTSHARSGDVISFEASTFTGSSTGTAELCDTSGANCNAATSSFAITAGTGTGTLSVPAAFTGAKALKLSSGSETALRPITVLGSPTLTANLSGGGAGTVVTLSGTNWDPSQAISVGGYRAGPPFPPPASSDPAVTVTAGANGNMTASFTVNDLNTVNLGAQQSHRTPPIFASVAFSASGDSCTAKVGAATNGSCSLLETVKLDVTAGDLKMSKESGDVVLSGVQLDGTAQAATGSLQDATVMDHRGGTLGWSLVGSFSGLSGPAEIAPDKLSWTPSCAAAGNNDDAVSVGAAGAFANDTDALPLCAVTSGNLGVDGVSGGDTVADADLSLALLANQAAGSYIGTLKLTLS
jgi:hypothetical protein